MNKELSIKRQKEAGTYLRNEEIKKDYRKGDGRVLGKMYGVSRERIRQILLLPSEDPIPQRKPWWQFWR